jgi:hypothetical protein
VKIVIEKDKESGMSSLLCGDYERFSDSIYEELEVRSIYGLDNLVNWAIREGYMNSPSERRKQ